MSVRQSSLALKKHLNRLDFFWTQSLPVLIALCLLPALKQLRTVPAAVLSQDAVKSMEELL